MKTFEILKADLSDVTELAQIFLGHISQHAEYISHGEIQMGVGEGRFVDGTFVTNVAPNGEKMWIKYINEKLSSPESAVVYKAVRDGDIVGFCVTEITDDGADPFGMICDVLVKEECRIGGIGTELINRALEWLRQAGIKDVYLESGLHNHSAHEYFIRRGFKKVSEIYKLIEG